MNGKKKIPNIDDHGNKPVIENRANISILTIVNYIGGQIDNSLKSTVILTPDQFAFGYESEDKGFVFKKYSKRYDSDFTLSKIANLLGIDADADSVVDALYNLSDYGFPDTEDEIGYIRFLRRLTGREVINTNKADPRVLT